MKTYIKFLINLFNISLLKIFIIFFIIILITNILEQIEFFKNIDLSFFYLFFLSLLNTPSVLFEILPFIFLLGTQVFFIHLIDKNELQVFKYSGLNNIKIIKILGLYSFILGIIMVIFFYNGSSILKNSYLLIKNNYSDDNKYLAVITENGLWIKDEINDNINESRRIDISNVFSSNRLSLGNSFESGESITLGLNFKKEKVNVDNKIDKIEEYIDFKLASVFRLDEEKNIPTSSTLNKKNSNIFGEFNFKPTRNISLGYNFSLTDDLNTFEYNSLITKIEFGNFITQFDYLEERGAVGSTNIIENTTKYNFDNQNSISFNTRRNRKLDLTEYYDLVYEYKNDCLVAGVKYKKNYYNDADIKPVEELFFSITIVPLGTFSPDKMALK